MEVSSIREETRLPEEVQHLEIRKQVQQVDKLQLRRGLGVVIACNDAEGSRSLGQQRPALY
jgi:hypothetical protein